ncbi:type II/IV secretion system protein [Patescibacteria group bacterium]|nr:MAG: type II/IV secretion system protein [Patescibacteria group bacterium]
MSHDIQSIEDLLKYTGAKAAVYVPSKHGDQTPVEKFEEKMYDVRLKEREMEAETQAKTSGVPYVNLKGFPISPEALRLVPQERAQSTNAVCFLFTGSEIRLAALNPHDQPVKDLLFELQERHKANGGIYKISEESFRVAINAYETLPKIKEIVKGVKVTDDELDKFKSQLNTYTDVQKVMDHASVTDIMTIIMAAGLQFSTSDVHVEAEQEKIAVRFRIDGVLQNVATLPHDFWKKIVARIKLISGLKINVTDRPQDGRFSIFLKEGDTDVRVSTIPTTWGESVVMRILKPGSINVGFEELGFRPLAAGKLLKEIQKPHGMIMTTGPTGSGKTTTLYAILQKLNTSGVKIITLEDPIEYKLEGINQSQIDQSKNYTFAGGLRSILRQDPDIVMVGEIRDLETAEVAINAALTGHLMLSTLHTTDAAGAIPRFISMGVKPFLLAPSLNAILGQRLARKICENCKTETSLEPDQLTFVKKVVAEIPPTSGEKIRPETDWKFYKGTGCEVCNQSGYKGRTGIYEILIMSEEINASLSESISEYQVRELAKQQGMTTLQQDGILKVLDGITTVGEILRVAGEGM